MYKKLVMCIKKDYLREGGSLNQKTMKTIKD